MMCFESGIRCSSSAPVSRIRDDQAALTAHSSTDVDHAIDLGDLGSVLRAASFEKLGHTRQAPGDVLRLGDLARRSGQTRAGWHFLPFLDLDMGARGDRIAGEDFPLFANDDDLRMEILLVLNDHRSHDAGRFVDLLADRHALDHVAELDASRLLSDNGHVVGIPLYECFPLLNGASIGDGNH